MDSLSKTVVTHDQLALICRRLLVEGLAQAEELKEGWYNTTFLLTTQSGRRVVLKVAPPDDYVRLRYEAGMMAAEAAVMRLVNGVPEARCPKLLAFDDSRKDIGHELLMMEFVEGQALHQLREHATEAVVNRARHEFGVALRHLHQVEGSHFGFFGQATSTDWPSAYHQSIEELILDAAEMQFEIPVDAIRRAVTRHLPSLASVRTPSLIHWDCWEPNLIVDPATGRLNGIIDFERAMWADPLMEAAWLSPGDAFLQGYGVDLRETPGGKVRRALYNLHLWVLMIVETPYRKYPTNQYEVDARKGLAEMLAFLESDEAIRQTD